MKETLRRYLSLAIAVIIMVTSNSPMYVKAASSSSMRGSKEGYVGIDHSYEMTDLIELTSAYTAPRTSDLSMTFSSTGLGLPSTFAHSMTRYVTVSLYEEDYWGNPNDLVVKYNSRFELTSTGTYSFKLVNPFNRIECYNSPVEIESEAEMELFISVLVDKVTGDPETQVYPPQLFGYRIWTN